MASGTFMPKPSQNFLCKLRKFFFSYFCTRCQFFQFVDSELENIYFVLGRNRFANLQIQLRGIQIWERIPGEGKLLTDPINSQTFIVLIAFSLVSLVLGKQVVY